MTPGDHVAAVRASVEAAGLLDEVSAVAGERAVEVEDIFGQSTKRAHVQARRAAWARARERGLSAGKIARMWRTGERNVRRGVQVLEQRAHLEETLRSFARRAAA